MIISRILSIIVMLVATVENFAQDSPSVPGQYFPGITVKNVIENYLIAIGGRNLFADVEDRTSIMHGNIDGKTLKISIEQKTPNKLKQTIISNRIEQIILYNGEECAWFIEGKKIPIEETHLAKLQIDTEMKFLLHPESSGVTIDFVETELIDSIKCYKLKLNTNKDLYWFQFYSVSSGMKIKELKEVKTEHGVFIQETFLSDYREVQGLKFPFRIKQTLGAQTIIMIVDSIALNSGLNDNIFIIPD